MTQRIIGLLATPGVELPPARLFGTPQLVIKHVPDLLDVRQITTRDGAGVERTYLCSSHRGMTRYITFPETALPLPVNEFALDLTSDEYGGGTRWDLQPDQPPTPGDLRIGDWLPAWDSDAALSVQRVVGLKQLSAQHARISTRDRLGTLRSFQAFRDERIAFPRDATGRYAGLGLRDETSDPYFGLFRNTVTGAHFMFVKHPFGRGRWPKSIPEYDPDLPARFDTAGNQVPYVTRPPWSGSAGASDRAGRMVELERLELTTKPPSAREAFRNTAT